MSKWSPRQIATAAIIAALYTVMSLLSSIFGLTYGPIQCRFSEALTVLTFLNPLATWGLFVGCILSNILSPYGPLDLIFGSLATLLAGLLTARCKNKWLAPLPPILANILVVPQVLRIVYGAPDSIWYLTATVGIGEVISCGILGMLLLFALQKNANQIFQS